jgi:hypothetical protein
VGVLGLTLYTLPFFLIEGMRVTGLGQDLYRLCLGRVTVLPVVDAHISLGLDFYLKCAQRFILVFLLILIF